MRRLEARHIRDFTRDGRMFEDRITQVMDRPSSNNGVWQVIHSPFSSYLDDFRPADKNGVIDETIEKLKTQCASPIIIDLLATPAALHDLRLSLLGGRKIKGMSVSLTDQRDTPTRNYDDEQGISITTGNLREDETWSRIQAWLGPDKADLIVERGYGGLKQLPSNSEFGLAAIQKIWSFLSPEGGLAMIQVPPERALRRLGITMKNWTERLEKSHIDFQYLPSYEPRIPHIGNYGALILRKTTKDSVIPS